MVCTGDPVTFAGFADVSGVFSTVSAVTLGDLQPVSTSGVTLTTHCASVETLNVTCPINRFEDCLATLLTASDSARECADVTIR